LNTPITPWIDLTLHQAQRCHHLAWFLYGCLEREHLLNVDALRRMVVSWGRVASHHGLGHHPSQPLPLSAKPRSRSGRWGRCVSANGGR